MIDKSLPDIGAEDLLRLQTNRVPESRSLEYKQALPGGTDADRKEFLADVSSFANATGGDLIYGIVEAREDGKASGVPETVEGLAVSNVDAETRRLENMLRDGIAPRLPGVQFHWVPALPKGPVLIIRIPRSWAGPHMVTYQQHSRFYSRHAGGKYALDVFELRQSFLGSGSLSERARELRAERVGRLVAGETPVPLSTTRYVSVLFLPHAALAGATDVDILLLANQRDHLRPLYASGWGGTFNLDGYVTYSPNSSGSNMSYLQVYRNGTIESVSSELLSDRGNGHVNFPSTAFAQELSALTNRAQAVMRTLAIDPPASLYVSLLGARGAVLGISQHLSFYRDMHAKPFDRDNLLFREILLTKWGVDLLQTLRPLLDELWQAAGLARCFDYDDEGNWNPR